MKVAALHQRISLRIGVDVAAEDQNPLNESPYTAYAAGHQGDDNADDSLFVIPQVKLMDSPSAEEDSQQTRDQLCFGCIIPLLFLAVLPRFHN